MLIVARHSIHYHMKWVTNVAVDTSEHAQMTGYIQKKNPFDRIQSIW